MKFKALICILIVAFLLVGCSMNNDNPTFPTEHDSTTTTTTSGGDSSDTTTANGGTTVPTTSPSGVTTTESTEIPSTIGGDSTLYMQKVSVSGMPVIIGDSRNRVKVSAAGLLNGNAENPMYILVTNIGEDDIFSATITATVSGKSVEFNVFYLPSGGSVWAESIELYKYNANDKFIIDNSSAVIVSSTVAGIPVDESTSGIVNVYAGEKDGGRGIFIENVSGKKIKKLVLKYRPVVGEGGLYSSPSQIVIENFEDGAKAFKANSYMFGVSVVDVQVTY